MIRIKGISKEVDGQVIIDRITCKIEKGATFIIGDSGAGKTTLLNLIGLIDTVTTGEIEYTNSDYYYRSGTIDADYFRAAHIGWIFQDSNLIDGLTAKENIELAASLSANGLASDKISELFETFNLTYLKDKKIDVLSGGEKQRISIIRALAKGADIILADEPTGNLDSDNSEAVFKTLKEVAIDKTVLIVTHNTDGAYKYGDRIIRIKDGKIEYDSKQLNDNGDGDGVELSDFKQSFPKASEEFQLSVNKLSNQYIRLLSKNNFSRVSTKIKSIIFASAFSAAFAGIIFSLGKTVSSRINEMNYTYYDADIVNVMYDYSLNNENLIFSAAEGKPITSNLQKDVEKTGYFKKIVPVVTWPLYIEGSFSSIDVKFIDTDAFFPERYESTEITGEFPKSAREIAIGKDIAEDFYGSTDIAIGNTIRLENDYGNTFIYDIVGVNEHKNIDGVYYNYIPAQSILGHQYVEYSSDLYERDELQSDNISLSSLISGMCQPYSEDVKVIFGRTPEKDGEIVISRYSLMELIDNVYDGEDVFDIDWNSDHNNSRQEKWLTEIFSKDYLISANDAFDVKIVGIYDGETDTFLGNEKWVNAIYKIEPTMLQCYTDGLSTAENYADFVMPDGLTYESYYAERFSTAIEMGNMWKLILLAVTITMIILTAVIINSFSKITINQRRHELGILKAVGSSSNDLTALLLYDSFVTGMFSGVTAVLIYVLFVIVAPFIMKIKISSKMVLIATSFIIFLFPILAFLVLTYGKIKAISKTLPIDLIRGSR